MAELTKKELKQIEKELKSLKNNRIKTIKHLDRFNQLIENPNLLRAYNLHYADIPIAEVLKSDMLWKSLQNYGEEDPELSEYIKNYQHKTQILKMAVRLSFR